MKKYISKFILVLSLAFVLFAPYLSFAQTEYVPDQGGGRSTPFDNPNLGCFDTYQAAGQRLGDLFSYGTCIIVSAIVPLLFSLALIAFLYGVVKFLMNADDQEARDKGKLFMIWGIVALAVMFSVWGLVGILRNTFGVTNSAIPSLPVRTN